MIPGELGEFPAVGGRGQPAGLYTQIPVRRLKLWVLARFRTNYRWAVLERRPRADGPLDLTAAILPSF